MYSTFCSKFQNLSLSQKPIESRLGPMKLSCLFCDQLSTSAAVCLLSPWRTRTEKQCCSLLILKHKLHAFLWWVDDLNETKTLPMRGGTSMTGGNLESHLFHDTLKSYYSDGTKKQRRSLLRKESICAPNLEPLAYNKKDLVLLMSWLCFSNSPAVKKTTQRLLFNHLFISSPPSSSLPPSYYSHVCCMPQHTCRGWEDM